MAELGYDAKLDYRTLSCILPAETPPDQRKLGTAPSSKSPLIRAQFSLWQRLARTDAQNSRNRALILVDIGDTQYVNDNKYGLIGEFFLDRCT
jgi:hypothetical protein